MDPVDLHRSGNPAEMLVYHAENEGGDGFDHSILVAMIVCSSFQAMIIDQFH